MRLIAVWMVLVTCFLVTSAARAAADPTAEWPQFRGPGGQGHALARDLPLRWSETQNVAWRTPLPGRAWSSPVIEGETIWMTTALDTPAKEADVKRRLKANTGSQPLIVSESISLRALGVDRRTGKLLHDIELMTRREPQWIHTLNSYASPTPIVEAGRLYCHFGSYGTACLETRSGEVIWTQQTLRVMHENGPGGSPVLSGNHLVAHFDGSDEQFIAGLDKRTGKVAWKTKRSGELNSNPQLQKAYATPLLVAIAGRPQVISPAADWLYAYDPATGRELWKQRYGLLGFSNVARPVFGHGLVYLSTGFMRSELLAIRPPGAGREAAEIVWRYRQAVPKQPSPLLVGDEIYIVHGTTGVVSCLDARTGKAIWKERVGGNFSASPLYADGRIHLFRREGETVVIQPGRAYKLLAENKLDGQIMASPAAVGRALYLRTDKALYRIEGPPRQARVPDPGSRR